MRTIAEISSQFAEVGEEGDISAQAHAYGMNAGLRDAIRLVASGKTNDDILEFATHLQQQYRSVGDDYSDIFEQARLTALLWSAERFDWNAAGKAIPHQQSGR